MFNQINGIPIIELRLVREYKQNRIHKKRRVNKKWRKRYGTTPIYWDEDTAYLAEMNGRRTLICHPKVVKILKERFAKTQDKGVPADV
jgi:hypothetical protein